MKTLYKIAIPGLLASVALFVVGQDLIEISQHNEQQAAIRAGYGLMFDAGCVRPDHSRTERFKLISDGDKIHVEANRITIFCAKHAEVPVTVTARFTWKAPTTRKKGEVLLPADISHYNATHNGDLLIVAGNATEAVFNGLLPGDHFFTIQTAATDGQLSAVAGPVQVTVN